MNLKTMNQTEFEHYMTTDLMPELVEEMGELTHVLLSEKNKFTFASTCEQCGCLVVYKKEFDFPKGLSKADDIIAYLENLTGLDVAYREEIEECDCICDDSEYDDYGDEDLSEEDDDEYSSYNYDDDESDNY